MVGSAILKKLEEKGYNKIINVDKKKLNKIKKKKLNNFFLKKKSQTLFLWLLLKLEEFTQTTLIKQNL